MTPVERTRERLQDAGWAIIAVDGAVVIAAHAAQRQLLAAIAVADRQAKVALRRAQQAPRWRAWLAAGGAVEVWAWGRGVGGRSRRGQHGGLIRLPVRAPSLSPPEPEDGALTFAEGDA